MALILDKAATPTFTAPVTLKSYNDKGKLVSHEFKMTFKRKSRTEINEYIDADKDQLDTHAGLSAEEKLDFDLNKLMEVIEGWSDVNIGGSTEFNRDNLRIVLMTFPSAGFDIYQQYLLANGGAKAGN